MLILISITDLARDLIAHLATIHKIPPTQRPQQQVNGSASLSGVGAINGDSSLPNGIPSVKNCQQSVQNDGRYANANEAENVAQELRHIKNSLVELKGQMNTQKVEQVLNNYYITIC